MPATRKEKSKNAARKRRSEESEHLQILAEYLPFAQGTINLLDRASIIRILIGVLRYKEATGRDYTYVDTVPKFNFIEALNGFVFMLDSKLKILYISNSVFQHMQIPQVDMVGTSILTYIHPDDQNDFENKFKQLYNYNCELGRKFRHISFTLRMHCEWHSKVRSDRVLHKFKVVQISGRVIPHAQVDTSRTYENFPFAAIVQPIPSAVRELPLISNTFVLKCAMDYRILFCEKEIQQYFDYSAKDMIGQCYYDFIHPEDVMIVQTAHQDFLRTGKSCSAVYRFLNKCGGWVQVVTTATALTKRKNSCDGENGMLCINYIHSGIENKGSIEHTCPKRTKRQALKKKQYESKDDSKMFACENNNRNHESQVKVDNKEMKFNSDGQEICFNSGDQETSVCSNGEGIPIKLNNPVSHSNSKEMPIASNGKESLAEIKMDTSILSILSNMKMLSTPTLSPICSTLSNGETTPSCSTLSNRENDVSVAMKMLPTPTLSPVYSTLLNRERTPSCSTLLNEERTYSFPTLLNEERTPSFSTLSNRENDVSVAMKMLPTPTLSPICSTLLYGENDVSVAMTEKYNITDSRVYTNISDNQEPNFDMSLNNDSVGRTSSDWFDSFFMNELNEGLSLPEITYTDILATLGPPSSNRNSTTEYHHMNKDVMDSSSRYTSYNHQIFPHMHGYIYPNSQ